MIKLLLVAAWTGILLGFLAGAVSGLFFHREDWLGGYGSWSRRMVRPGHIAFFGIALINLGLAASLHLLAPAAVPAILPWLFIAGAIGMPLVCYLSAYRKSFRHLFFIPVPCLLAGTVIFFVEVLWP